MKYWLYLLHANVHYIVRNWYKWEMNNLKMDSGKETKERGRNLGFQYIGHCESEKNVNWACRIIKDTLI